MSLISVSIVNVALPSIQSSLSASQSELQWVLSGYALTFGRFLLVGTFQGRAMTAMVQTYVMASQMSGGMPFALGTAVVCTAPRELFDQKLQGVFNRMITSYEASVSKPSKKD